MVYRIHQAIMNDFELHNDEIMLKIIFHVLVSKKRKICCHIKTEAYWAHQEMTSYNSNDQ